MQINFKLFLPLILFSCSGLEQSEADKVRRQNVKGEFVYRHSGDQLYPPVPLEPKEREKYPWEKNTR